MGTNMVTDGGDVTTSWRSCRPDWEIAGKERSSDCPQEAKPSLPSPECDRLMMVS
jgi:hypothetical protein